ncbi:MAG: helix-turn-helix domain-containing protein [bacterium]
MSNHYKDSIIKYLDPLLDSFGYPSFVFDADERILKVNSTLKRIIRKLHVDIADVNVDKLLKLNGVKCRFNKQQIRKKRIYMLKYRDKKVVYLTLLTKDNRYKGGIVIIMDRRFQDLFIDWYEILNSEHIGYIAKKINIMDGGSIQLRKFLNEVEKSVMVQVIKKTNNKSEAIKLLGISRRTFYYKLKKYKLL